MFVRTHRRGWTALGGVLAALAVAACSSPASAPPATTPTPAATVAATPTAPLATSTATAAATAPATGGAGATGAWSGTWKRLAPAAGNGSLALTLQQQGTTLTGQIQLLDSACFTKPEPLIGTLQGTTAAFAVANDGITASFKGDLAGTSISGTMLVTCAAGTGTGTWQATKS